MLLVIEKLKMVFGQSVVVVDVELVVLVDVLELVLLLVLVELDVDDDVLEQLDWVMASVHTSFDKDPTERVLHAMESPHVDCIGHLTSRRINVRNPSTIEVEKVVEGALATGTFLEINSQPDRLDLRDANARLAGEAGVTLVISSDGHSTKALRYVELGVAQARRAWLTKDQILNTRPWKAIEKLRK